MGGTRARHAPAFRYGIPRPAQDALPPALRWISLPLLPGLPCSPWQRLRPPPPVPPRAGQAPTPMAAAAPSQGRGRGHLRQREAE